MKSQIKKLISIFACVCLLLTAIIIPASAADSTAGYVKVTEAPADWSGDYLIVYENGDDSKVLDGSLSKIDAEGNHITVAVADNKIEANDTTNAAKFTIAKSGDNYTLKSASGYYIGHTSDANKISSSTSTQYANTITINDDDTVNIIASGGPYLRFNNAASNGNRFRYYKSSTYSSQQPIALYKLETVDGGETPDEGGNEGGDETPDVPAADSTLSIADAAALGAGMTHNTTTEGKYYVEGVIKSVANTMYGNMTIEDAEGNSLYIYGTYDADGTKRYDAMETKPVAGDTVKLYGVIGNYNGAQMKNAWIVEHTPATTPGEGEGGEGGEGDNTPVVEDPAADSTLTIAEALALGASKEHNTYTEGKYYVSGEIIEIYNDMYGNMRIKDADGNILTVYGTYDADGTNRYDSMETKPVAGDTVKVYGIVGQFNGTAQIKNGWIVEHTPATTPGEGEGGEGGDDNTGDDTTVFDPTGKTAAEIVNAAYELAAGEAFEKNATLTGVITSVDTEYSTQYSNVTVTIAVDGADADKPIKCFRLKGDGADVIAVGDTITVTGIIKNYQHTSGDTEVEFDSGCTLDSYVKADGGNDNDGNEGGQTPEGNPAPDETNTLTVAEAIELAKIQESSSYAEGKYYVTGKIVAIASTQYGNMYIADENGNELYVYGVYSADGETYFDSLDPQPAVGDTITLYGQIGKHYEEIQMKSGWMTNLVKGEGEVVEDTDPAADSVLTIEEAIELGLSKRHNTYTENKYYVTGEILEVYEENYGNLRLQDEDGNILVVYGTYNEDGSLKYGEMDVKPVAGETVTVYGIIGQYNNVAQMKNGWFTTAPATDGDKNDTTTGGTTTGGTTTGGTTTGTTTDTNTGAGSTTDTTSPVTGDAVGSCVAMAIAAAAVILYTSKKR